MSRVFPTWLLPISALLLCMLSSTAYAQGVPDPHAVVSGLLEGYKAFAFPESVLKSANYLFWSLATISLVWTMGTLLLRRADIGEFFLELFRFIVITGFFSWLLLNASSTNPDEGFVNMIINSFAKMGDATFNESGSLAEPANHIADIGFNIFNQVINQSVDWKNSDALLAGSLSIMIVMALTLVAAQLVLVLIMAWILAYGGIFLLGFGGSRWTSSVAISYYKNVIAVGAALLALALVIAVGRVFLDQMSVALTSDGVPVTFRALCAMLIVALIMAVLCTKVPGLLYTLVTGSQLGLLAGTASMAGTAIMTGGNHAMASFTRQTDNNRNTLADGRRESVMDAYSKVSSGLYGSDALYQPTHFGDYGAQGSAVAAFGQSGRGSVFGVSDSQDVWVNNAPPTHQPSAERGPRGDASSPQSSSAANSAPDPVAQNRAVNQPSATTTGSQSHNQPDNQPHKGSNGLSGPSSADPAVTQLMEGMAPQQASHAASPHSISTAATQQTLEGQPPQLASASAGMIQPDNGSMTSHATPSTGSAVTTAGHATVNAGQMATDNGAAGSTVGQSTVSTGQAAANIVQPGGAGPSQVGKGVPQTGSDGSKTPYGIAQTASNPYGIGPSASAAGTSHQPPVGDAPSSQGATTAASSAENGHSKGGFQPAVLTTPATHRTQTGTTVDASSVASSSTQPYVDSTPRANPMDTIPVNPSDEVAAFRDRKTPFDITRKDR